MSIKIILTIIAIIVFLGFLLAAAFRYLGYFITQKTLGVRMDDSVATSKMSIDDFEDLERESKDFLSGRNNLKGHFYFQKLNGNKEYLGIVIVVHGHHLLHEDYLPEINYFAQKGYLVYAYDSTGTGKSEGDCPLGQTQWMLDLNEALHMIESLKEYEHLPIYIWGHSIGAFAACAVMNFSHIRVKGILAFAPSNSGYEFAKTFWEMYPHPSFITRQTYYAMKKLEDKNFGLYSEYTVLSGINHTDTRILLIQSKDDPQVIFASSMAKYEKDFTNKNAKILILEEGKHWTFRKDNALNKEFMDRLCDDVFISI